MSRSPRVALALLLALLLAACGKDLTHQSDQVLFDYAGAVRWSDFDAAWIFVDPEVRTKHPLTDLEFERYKLVQVTGYEVKGSRQDADGGIDQVVEIRYVNKLTQVERTVLDQQHWRWDSAQRHWWLTSGLPDFTRDSR